MEQSADAMHGFEHGGGATGWIDGSVDPGVAMVACNDPLVGELRAFDLADYVPDDAALVVLPRDKVDAHPARPDVVAEGKSALPSLGHACAGEGFEDGGGVAVAEGNGGYSRLI